MAGHRVADTEAGRIVDIDLAVEVLVGIAAEYMVRPEVLADTAARAPNQYWVLLVPALALLPSILLVMV